MRSLVVVFLLSTIVFHVPAALASISAERVEELTHRIARCQLPETARPASEELGRARQPERDDLARRAGRFEAHRSLPPVISRNQAGWW